MQAIGTALAKMHASTIVHGDLTTSNMMLRPLPGHRPNFEVVSHPCLGMHNAAFVIVDTKVPALRC